MKAIIKQGTKTAAPADSINGWLAEHGYKPVEKDATIHECYLCIMWFHRFETILGNIRGRRAAIVRAIVEAEDHPCISEYTVNEWIKVAYGRDSE